mgnify:CR=1 FL=1
MAENKPKRKQRAPSWCAQLPNRLGRRMTEYCLRKRLVAVCAFSRIRCAADNDRAHRGRVDKKSGNLYDHADLQGAGRPACRVPGRTGR